MNSTVIAAVVQMTSTPYVETNLATAERLVRRAVEQGASLVVLPEGFAYIGPEDRIIPIVEPLPEGGPILKQFRNLAQELKCDLILGGFPEQGATGKPFNSCIHLNPAGDIVSVYRKMHLFDADFPDGNKHHESSRCEPGDTVVVTPLPFGLMGLSICYDLRFPELYRKQIEQGAVALAVPSAFTQTTGKDHWHVLLRARAIESQAYVLAAAQTGHHYGERYSYGHSMIVDPWGTIIAECLQGHGQGIMLAEISISEVDRVRALIPCLQHRRL